jgi:uncharacterized protein YbaA (DUF1428 family)
MLALTAEVGDVAIRTDLSKCYILVTVPASTLDNWQELLTPASPVSSVFGRTSAVTAQSGDYGTDQITESETKVFVTPAEKSAITHSNRTALDNVSNTNTGDETDTTIKTKLGISTLSGSNTGDETASTIKTKVQNEDVQMNSIGLGNATEANCKMKATGQYYSLQATTDMTIDWALSNVQYIKLANGDNGAFSFTNGKAGGRYLLYVLQPDSGVAGTVSWPSTDTLHWVGGSAPTLTVTNAKMDIITFGYELNTAKYYGSFGLNA